jgi:hypothetical protein
MQRSSFAAAPKYSKKSVSNLKNGVFRSSSKMITLSFKVEPHELVKKSGGLEKARVHWHTVAYANKLRANGHVETILPELGVLRKRQNGRGQHHSP